MYLVAFLPVIDQLNQLKFFPLLVTVSDSLHLLKLVSEGNLFAKKGARDTVNRVKNRFDC